MGRLREYLVLLLGFTMVGTTTTAQAPDWPDPYPANPATVGAFLENQFGGLMSECGMPQLRVEVRRTVRDTIRTVSAVPPLVRRRLPMKDRVVLRSRESASRVFGYIYPSTDVATAYPDPARYLLIDMEADPVQMLADGWSSVAHAHTCSSIITAAADANLNIPFADLKSALSTNYSNKTQTVLALVEGTFVSPISAMLNNDSQVDQTLANFLFWEWYSRNSNLASLPQFYVAQFDGFTLYQFVRSRRDVNGQFSFSAGFAAPGIASIKSMIQGGVLQSDSTDVRAFATGFYVPQNRNSARAQPEPLPTPQSLATTLSQVRPVIAVVDPLVLQNRPNIHAVDVLGMPTALCSLNSWRIEAPAPPGSLTLASATEQPDNRTCRFSVSFEARPDVFGAHAGNLSLQYSLVSIRTPANQQVHLKAPQASTSPMVQLGQVNPMWSKREVVGPTGTQTDFIWQVPFVLDDYQNPTSGAPVGVRNGSLSCEQGEVNVTADATVTVGTVAGQRSATIGVTHSLFAGEDLDDKAQPLRECRFSATLDLPLKTGGSATRSISGARLFYPAKRQTPPVVPQQTPAAAPVKSPVP